MSNADSKPPATPMTYRDAGVDLDAGNRLVDRIRPVAQRTRRAGVLSSPGGFGALFELPVGRYKQPVLVSGTDGVGTKLKLALASGRHDTIGIDLVAMCANDIIVPGAEPLFFLDYYATGRLETEVAASVIEGIGRGCEYAGAALVGGETAEMPGMYADEDYDLAGFCVGVVEKDRIIDGSRITPGDILIGLASSGPHSNGYSLIRRILDASGASLDSAFAAGTLGAALLEPTRIYVKALLALIAACDVRGLAHITGGGLPENLPRSLPDDTRAIIDLDAWSRPPVFDWLQEQGHVEPFEMLRTFNCGIGMVVCVPPDAVDRAHAVLRQHGETSWTIGSITADTGAPNVEFKAL